MYWFERLLPPQRARVFLQMAIFVKTRYGACFYYPISALLLIGKLELLSYESPLSLQLHTMSFIALALADTVRFWLGSQGNLNGQVFHISAFVFLSVCPLLPVLLFFAFFAEHTLWFDRIAGSCLLVLIFSELLLSVVILWELLRQETARFVRLRDEINAVGDRTAAAALR